jgi:small conductance mechanosensitive channel
MPHFRRKRIQSSTRARARQLTLGTIQRAREARRQLLLLVPLTAAVLVAYAQRQELFGVDTPVRIAAALLLVVLGYALARDIGRFVAPYLFRRMDPATAGTLGFVIRLLGVGLVAILALRLAGLPPETLAVGGAVTAIIVGLAAQQTFGNVFAGMVLLSARPFRVGDRIRLHAGGVAGTIEGTVSALGLLYVVLHSGEDQILVPNSVVLAAAVVPLREPDGVDLRVRLRPDVRPSEVQRLLAATVQTPVRGEPHISLEEMDSDEVLMRVTATPEVPADGQRLADEILTAMAKVTREGLTEERRHLRATVAGERP